MAVRKRSTCSAAGGTSSTRKAPGVEAEGAGGLPEGDGNGLPEGTDEDDGPGAVLPLSGPTAGADGAGADGAGVSFEALAGGSAAWSVPPVPRSAVKTAVRQQHGRAQVVRRNWGDFAENIRTSRCP
jgi:hypothetical protein